MTRRLQILPEVLPAPTAVSTAPSGTRGRTLAHMQKLLATAAVMPVACTKTDTQEAVTVTIPSATASTSAQPTSSISLIPETHPSATATPTGTAPDIGYAVVDPMPAPARCMGLAAASKISTRWVTDAQGLLLEITVTLPTNGQWTGAVFNGQPSAWSGQVVSSNSHGPVVVTRVRPAPNNTSFGLSLGVTCSAGVGQLSLTAALPATLTSNTKVTIQANDY